MIERVLQPELISIVDEKTVGEQIERIARSKRMAPKPFKPSAFFEHGQWWLDCGYDHEDQALQFSVVDAEPGAGFVKYRGKRYEIDFEQV